MTGELHKWWNDYDAGLATDANEEGYSVGLGMEIPIFSGFLTKNKVAEARARLAEISEEKLLLKEGIGLQVRDTFLSLNAAEKSHQATLDAMDAAVENRDLNTRAYQHGLVENRGCHPRPVDGGDDVRPALQGPLRPCGPPVATAPGGRRPGARCAGTLMAATVPFRMRSNPLKYTGRAVFFACLFFFCFFGFLT